MSDTTLQTQTSSTTAAIDFIKLLYEPGDLICFAFQSADTWKQAFRTFEDAIKPETMALIQKANDSDHNIYVAMNVYNSPGRTEGNIAAVRNVWAEIDSNGRENLEKVFASRLVPEPTIVNESSPGKFHVIWKVKDATVEESKILLKAICAEFNGDPNATDAARVLRLPGFKNNKYPEKPEVEIVHLSENTSRYRLSDFKLESSKVEKPNATLPPPNSKSIIPLGMHDSWLISYCGKLRQDGLEFPEIESAAIRACEQQMPDRGSDWREMVTKCAKSACTYPVGDPGPTVTIGGVLPGQAPSVQKNTKPPVPIVEVDSTMLAAVPEFVDEASEAAIPPFDPSVMNGIYKEMVELIQEGTTLAPQFAFAIAKTVIGAKMAGNVRFENLDIEPRYYTSLIGETGSGKGEAWRRTMQILRPQGEAQPDSVCCGIKIINSADSGAGLKDAFFDSPEDAPLICYVDEVEGLGNKAKELRNPAILDTIIEMADSTSISRVLAKRPGRGNSEKSNTKVKYNARFCMVMCGQDGNIYMKAFAGRTKLGLWDRFYPEFGKAVDEVGNLPAVNAEKAVKLFTKLALMKYSGTMTMSEEVMEAINNFWKSQTPDVRKKARWKKNLMLDAYMSAFGRGSMTVESADVEIATKIFTRQLIIRRVCFTAEVPDRIGYYLGLIKNITTTMQRQIDAGIAPALAAQSRRDYERKTNAHRDNETHIFERAWNTHRTTWLDTIHVKKDNGQIYEKFIPKPEDK